MTVHMPLTAVGRRAIFLVGFYIYMCNFPLIALAETLFSYSVILIPAAGLLESESQALCSCVCVPHSSMLSSHLVCGNGVTSAVLALAVLGLNLQRLCFWLVPLLGTISDSVPTIVPSPAPHCGCCLLIPWKTWEKDFWFPLSSCSCSLLVLSLWTKSKRREKVIVFLFFLSESFIYAFIQQIFIEC